MPTTKQTPTQLRFAAAYLSDDDEYVVEMICFCDDCAHIAKLDQNVKKKNVKLTKLMNSFMKNRIACL